MRAKEICQLGAVLQPDHMTLRGIQKRSRPQVNEPWTTLTMAVAEWNAGYGETLVGKRPEIRRKQPHRVCHLAAHYLRHGGGCERADRALNRTRFEGPLHHRHQVVRLSIRVHIHGRSEERRVGKECRS